MIKIIALLLFNFTFFSAYTQSLIANGSFEDRNVCTEYGVTCAPEAWFFIPSYVKTSPKEKNNHIEILLRGKGNTITNHIYTKLLCPLTEGEKYLFSILVKADISFDSLDVWMGESEPGRRGANSKHQTYTITTAHADSGKSKWKRYQFMFYARGFEKYLMLGNINTYRPPSRFGSVRTATRDPYYFIDDVKLKSVDDPGKTCPLYAAILDQVYSQDLRHPARFIEDVPLDKSLITGTDSVSRKIITWQIIDTPPGIKPVIDTLIIPDVLFKFNSSEINIKFILKLDSILNKIKYKNYNEIEVAGHTDNVGDVEYNNRLSLNRAITIREYIKTKQLNVKEFVVRGAGELIPRASNQTAAGRQQNRRVEIILKQ